jgi:hypothetical protein
MIKRTNLTSVNDDDGITTTTPLIGEDLLVAPGSTKKLEDIGSNSVAWTYVIIFKGYVGAGKFVIVGRVCTRAVSLFRRLIHVVFLSFRNNRHTWHGICCSERKIYSIQHRFDWHHIVGSLLYSIVVRRARSCRPKSDQFGGHCVCCVWRQSKHIIVENCKDWSQICCFLYSKYGVCVYWRNVCMFRFVFCFLTHHTHPHLYSWIFNSIYYFY